MLLNELASWLNVVAHKHREYLVGLGSVLYGNLLQQTLLGVHSCFPKLLRVHLTKTFIALGMDRLAVLCAVAILVEESLALLLGITILLHLVLIGAETAIPAKVRQGQGHPSKKTFQAIRIELNHELDVLENSLDTMISWLNPGGRLSVITFHSLEDRIVKTIFKRNMNPCTCPPEFPVCVCGKKPTGKVITRKPIVPSEQELAENSRAKSSKLRVFEKADV